jgi:CheY-like chemotaxis protein
MKNPIYIGCDVILLAEDDENHVALVQRAFRQAGLLNPLHVVNDGEQAIAYLNGEGKYADRDEFPLPCLVFLDLKMPNKNGFEVLEWIRNHPHLRSLRTIILTTSGATSDISRAYQLGATSFLTKPLDLRDFVQLTPTVKGYWMFLSGAPEAGREEPTVQPVEVKNASRRSPNTFVDCATTAENSSALRTESRFSPGWES